MAAINKEGEAYAVLYWNDIQESRRRRRREWALRDAVERGRVVSRECYESRSKCFCSSNEALPFPFENSVSICNRCTQYGPSRSRFTVELRHESTSFHYGDVKSLTEFQTYQDYVARSLGRAKYKRRCGDARHGNPWVRFEASRLCNLILRPTT